MIVLSFLIGVGMLAWSGWSLAGHVLPARERALRFALAFPFGCLSHVLILCLWSLIGVPLVWWSLLPAHLLLGGVLFFVPARLRPDALPALMPRAPGRGEMFLRVLCLVLLSMQAVFALTHAVLLPTYHIDSLTNWTMRAQLSWQDHAIALDATEVRGVAKPQYPFLVHGVQMAAHVIAPSWNDRAANTVTLLLTVSSFCSLLLLLARLRGFTIALAALSAITSMPLLSFHLAQGYGDIHLVTYLLLALGFLLLARSTQDSRWHLASAFMVAAAVWTKTEGMIIGLLPWLLLLAIDLPFPRGRRDRALAMSIGLGLSLLFPLFLFLKGLPFTPHDSDAALGLHPEALWPALTGFLSPSMGLTWLCIAIACVVVIRLWRRNDPRIDCRVLVLLFWGVLALLIILATYVFTPNARFLLNGESYFRQLMVPAALLIVVLIASVRGFSGRDRGGGEA